MIIEIKADPRMSAVDGTKFAKKQMGVSIGVRTVRRRLSDANLFVRYPAKAKRYQN